MMSNLQQYFDSTPYLTESQKIEITNLSNNKSKKLLNLLLKYSISHRKVAVSLLNLITSIADLPSSLNCKCQIEILKKKRIWQRKWTKAEDQQLKNICRQKYIIWSDVVEKFNSQYEDGFKRSSNTIKYRWYNKLNPVITQQIWKQQEDTIVLEYILKFGKQWQKIQGLLKFKRNEIQIIKRYYELLIKQETQEQKQNQIKDQNFQAHFQSQASRYQIDLEEAKLIQDYLNYEKKKNNGNGKKKMKLAKTQQRTTEIISQVLQSVSQDDAINYDSIKQHFDTTPQKEIQLNTSILEKIDSLGDIQFGLRNGDSKEINIFPQSQLKAILQYLHKNTQQNQQNQIQEQQPQKVDIYQQQNNGNIDPQLTDLQKNMLMIQMIRQQQYQQLQQQQLFYQQQAYQQYQQEVLNQIQYIQNEQPFCYFLQQNPQNLISQFYNFNDIQIKKEDTNDK